MRAAAAVFAFAAFAAASPQGVTSAIAPSSTPEAGCSPNYDGSFAISLVDVNTKRHLEKVRTCRVANTNGSRERPAPSTRN